MQTIRIDTKMAFFNISLDAIDVFLDFCLNNCIFDSHFKAAFTWQQLQSLR